MSENIRSAVAFFIGCLAVAVVAFAILGGIALIVHNGQAQTCAQSGGHWNATDDPVTAGGVQRVRECTR